MITTNKKMKKTNFLHYFCVSVVREEEKKKKFKRIQEEEEKQKTEHSKMADNSNCPTTEQNLDDALENASILKTVKIIARWMQALEEKRALQGDCDEPAGEDASTELESSEHEMIEFFKSFKEELYCKQQSEKIKIEVNDYDNCNIGIKTTDEIDDLLLNTNSRARANSTFQTVKYIGRWMKAVDRKTRKQPLNQLSITEEEHDEIKSSISLDDDEEEDENEEKGEEEMIRFFRSLKLDEKESATLQKVDADTTLPSKTQTDKDGKMQTDKDDKMQNDKDGKMQNESMEGTHQKDIERKAIVMNTVKFVIKWMEKVEANKTKDSSR